MKRILLGAVLVAGAMLATETTARAQFVAGGAVRVGPGGVAVSGGIVAARPRLFVPTYVSPVVSPVVVSPVVVNPTPVVTTTYLESAPVVTTTSPTFVGGGARKVKIKVKKGGVYAPGF
ncbi:MAG: hypothetical protein U0840_18705 [Gemmataceae bacterium]